MPSAGLSRANRAFVAQLNRKLPGPFTPDDAATAAGVDHARAARLLRHLAEQGWVARVQRGRTLVVISHEYSDMAGYDRILVMQGGRIVESGAHAALLDARGYSPHRPDVARQLRDNELPLTTLAEYRHLLHELGARVGKKA